MGSEFIANNGKAAAKTTLPGPGGPATSPARQFRNPLEQTREPAGELRNKEAGIREDASNIGPLRRLRGARQSLIQRTPLFAEAPAANTIQRQAFSTKTVQVRFGAAPARGAKVRVIDGSSGQFRGEEKEVDERGNVEIAAAEGDIIKAQKLSGGAFGSSTVVGSGDTVVINFEVAPAQKGRGQQFLNVPVEAHLRPGTTIKGQESKFDKDRQRRNAERLTTTVPRDSIEGESARGNAVSLGKGGRLFLRFDPPIFYTPGIPVLHLREYRPWEAFTVAFGNEVKRDAQGRVLELKADAAVSLAQNQRQRPHENDREPLGSNESTSISIPRRGGGPAAGSAYEWVEIQDRQGTGRQRPEEPGIDITRVHARRPQVDAMHIYLDVSGSMMAIEAGTEGSAIERSKFYLAADSIENKLLPSDDAQGIRYNFNYFLGRHQKNEDPKRNTEGVVGPDARGTPKPGSKKRPRLHLNSLADARKRLEKLRKIATTPRDKLKGQELKQQEALLEGNQKTPLATALSTGIHAASSDHGTNLDFRVIVIITDGRGQGANEAIEFARAVKGTGKNTVALELIAYKIPDNATPERIEFFKYNPGNAITLSTYEVQTQSELNAVLGAINKKYALSVTPHRE